MSVPRSEVGTVKKLPRRILIISSIMLAALLLAAFAPSTLSHPRSIGLTPLAMSTTWKGEMAPLGKLAPVPCADCGLTGNGFAPAGADNGTSIYNFSGAESCPSTGSCVAIGYYSDTSGNVNAVIESLTNGKWTPKKAPLPPGGSGIVLDALACPAVGKCVAAGQYTNYLAEQEGLIETLIDGKWKPTTAPLPASAGTGANDGVLLDGLSCPRVSSCVAVGGFTDSDGQQGLIETLSSGKWAATEAPQAAGAGGVGVILDGLSCPAVSFCVTVGAGGGLGTASGLIESLSNGRWTPTTAPLPAGANGEMESGATTVSCSAVSSCVAAGYYVDTATNFTSVLVETLSGGKWAPSTTPLPSGSSLGISPSLSLSCPANGSCVIAGDYTNINGNQLGLIESFSAGKWTLTSAPLPHGAATNPMASLNAVTCPAAGSCVAVGKNATNDGSNALIETLSSGKWTSSAAPLPPSASAKLHFSTT